MRVPAEAPFERAGTRRTRRAEARSGSGRPAPTFASHHVASSNSGPTNIQSDVFQQACSPSTGARVHVDTVPVLRDSYIPFSLGIGAESGHGRVHGRYGSVLRSLYGRHTLCLRTYAAGLHDVVDVSQMYRAEHGAGSSDDKNGHLVYVGLHVLRRKSQRYRDVALAPASALTTSACTKRSTAPAPTPRVRRSKSGPPQLLTGGVVAVAQIPASLLVVRGRLLLAPPAPGQP